MQALAVDQLVVETPGLQVVQGLAHELLEGQLEEDPPVELPLEALGERRPVGADALEALEDHLGPAVRQADQAGLV